MRASGCASCANRATIGGRDLDRQLADAGDPPGKLHAVWERGYLWVLDADRAVGHALLMHCCSTTRAGTASSTIATTTARHTRSTSVIGSLSEHVDRSVRLAAQWLEELAGDQPQAARVRAAAAQRLA